MVELVEVEDESFETKQVGPEKNEDDYYTDTGLSNCSEAMILTILISNSDSEISTDDEDTVPEEETLTERLLALRDIIPPTTRSYISNKVETTAGWIKSGLFFGGKTLWVVSTSALLLGVPWALAFAEEQQMVEMEKEMKMRDMGGEVDSPEITF